MDETLTSSTTLGQSGPESNENEEILLTPQIAWTGAAQKDAV